MLHQTHFTFSEELVPRKAGATRYIILHHSEVTSPHTAEDIHRWHLKKGWAGIGYHYFIAKGGEVFEGRPRDTVGAHTYGYNQESIGVCFEGDFSKENLTKQQESAAVKLLVILGIAYSDAELRRHSDLSQKKTCPGKNFPFNHLLQRVGNIITNIGFSTAITRQNRNLGDDIIAMERSAPPQNDRPEGEDALFTI